MSGRACRAHGAVAREGCDGCTIATLRTEVQRLTRERDAAQARTEESLQLADGLTYRVDAAESSLAAAERERDEERSRADDGWRNVQRFSEELAAARDVLRMAMEDVPGWYDAARSALGGGRG